MTREEWYKYKFRWLKRFFFSALVGLFAVAISFAQPNEAIRSVLGVLTALAIIPLIFMLCFIPVLHWKDRYRGTKSNLWGFFLVFETSGWSKIFYWFMHVLPDKNSEGPYANLD